MPILQPGFVTPVVPHQINVPMPDETGLSIQVIINNNGVGTIAYMDQVLMEIIDMFQAWPEKRPDADVTGVKWECETWNAIPTNALFPPEEDPPIES